MKKLLIVFVCFIFSLSVATTVFAQSNESQNKTVNADETIDGDYFAAGEVVTISGTVNGDVYALGEKLIIDGTVNGDVLGAAADVIIRGKVSDDVRIAGGQITVSGEIGKSLSVGAGNATVTETASVGGSLTGAAGSAQILAPIGREIRMGIGDITIDNNVGRSATLAAGTIALGSRAKINGDLTYWSDKQASIQNDSAVVGTTTHNMPNADQQKDTAKAFGAGALFLKILSFLLAFLIGALFIKYLPNFTTRLIDNISSKTLKSFGIGFLALILLPIAAVLAAITLVGIPISIIILFVIFMFIYFSKVFIALAIGRFLLNLMKYKSSLYLALFAGLVVYSFLTLIPVVNFVLFIFTMFIGTGSFVITKNQILNQLRAKKLL